MNNFFFKQHAQLLSAFVYLLFNLTIQAEELKPKAILWDLGDTLITHSSFCVIKNIGFSTTAKYSLHYLFTNYPLNQMFAVPKNTLWSVLAQDTTYDTSDSDALDPWGSKMPSLEVAWLDGLIKNEDMLKRALYLSELYTGYENSSLKEFVQKLIRWKYSENFAPCMHQIKSAVDLLHEVAAQRNHNGNKLHELFITSNYAREPFLQLYNDPENKQEIFNYFPEKNIFVSGFLHDSKPRISFFKTVLAAGKLNPQDTILIDDQRENIKTAESLGITGILWDKNNPKEAYEALRKAGALPN